MLTLLKSVKIRKYTEITFLHKERKNIFLFSFIYLFIYLLHNWRFPIRILKI